MEHNQEVLILSSCTFNMVAIKSSADTWDKTDLWAWKSLVVLAFLDCEGEKEEKEPLIW